MKGWLPLAGIGLLAALAGASLWLAGNHSAPPPTATGPVQVSAAALQAATFADPQGRPATLGQFAGKVVVINFWATWCVPCREEMPGFVRLQAQWKDRGVQFVGLAQDNPDKVAAFARELGVNYPLWLGGAEVMDLSRRLGNQQGVLPHTVLLDGNGQVLESRVGQYEEQALDRRLAALAGGR
jgi:thiol-disulfide isomerase/thioredoxin